MLKSLWLVLVLALPAAMQNAGFKVSGTVVREDKQDLSAAGSDRIVLRAEGGSTVAELGADGSFTFSNVRPGSYQVVVGPMVSTEPITVVVADRDVTGMRVVIPDVSPVRGT